MRSLAVVALGLALILLSLHPAVVSVVSWAIPTEPATERPLFASAFLALAGVAVLVAAAVAERRGRGASRARPDPPADDERADAAE